MPHESKHRVDPSTERQAPGGDASRQRRRCSQVAAANAAHPLEPGAHLGKYQLLRKLGAGGAGIVFEALDTERRLPAAVKVLHRFNPDTLVAFKSEFRVAANLSHPNLVTPYELGVEHERWFIAMELVAGSEFLAWVRPSGAARVDEARLRDALSQVLDGLDALHAEGIVHCDVKPSNVLVTHEGRVRIVDFGLAMLHHAARSGASGDCLLGSPAYMAPEQAAGDPVSPATDMYGLGMMLFEALTGMLAFDGPTYRILAEKAAFNGPSPATLLPDLPADLAELTRRLGMRLPSGRASVADARAVLSALPARACGPRSMPAPIDLVGRERELDCLQRAFERAQAGRGVLLHVRGPSGVGKSALLGACERVWSETALILSGRCHELESIPYKGLDHAVDVLRGHLLSLSGAEREALLPDDFANAVAMFPVLSDISHEQPTSAPHTGEHDDLRERAHAALAALLHNLRGRTPIILVLDDVHWADADGARMLEHLLAAPNPLAALFVFAYRPEEARQSVFLRRFAKPSEVRRPFDQETITLDPLSVHDAQALAARLLPAADAAARERIARDAEGVPFLVEQLALHERELGVAAPSLDEVIQARVGQLGPDAGKLLDAIALSGQPLPEALAAAAAGVDDVRPPLARLVFHCLARRTGGAETTRVGMYHDRIRAAVAGRLDAASRKAMHLRLAREGEARDLLPPNALADHYELAGEPASAALHALRSARLAESALAFDRAADMFARSVRLGQAAPQLAEARAGLARCLYRAGRCTEAGAAFLEAAAEESGPARVALQTHAVEAWLSCGQVRDALEVLKPLVEAVGRPFPEHVVDVVGSILRHSLRTRLSLLRKPRIHDRLDPALARRADVLWESGKGLLMVAPGEGMALALESLGPSLTSGDPHRIGRALAFAGSGFAPLLGASGERYLAWARELAEAYDDDHLRIMTSVGEATSGFLRGQWERATHAAEEVMRLSPRALAATFWEQSTVLTLAVSALEYQGELRAMEERSSAYLRVARARGDRLTAVTLVSAYGYTRAAQRDGEGLDVVIETMRGEMANWQLDFGTWDFYWLRLRVLRALCWGEVEQARALLDETWPQIEKYQLLRVPIVRLPALKLRQAVLLGQLESGEVDRALQREVRRLNRVLAREARPDGPVYALAGRAALHHHHGETAQRDSHLEQAQRRASEADLRVQSRMIARARALLDGRLDTLRPLDEELSAKGVSDAMAFAHYALPGFAHLRADEPGS